MKTATHSSTPACRARRVLGAASPAACEVFPTSAFAALDIPSLFGTIYIFLSLLAVPGFPPLVPLGGAALLLPAWAVSRHATGRAWRRNWNIASLLFICGTVVAQFFLPLTPHEVLSGVCMFLTVHRWFVPRGAREHLEIWGLGVLLLMTGTLHGGGVFTLLVLVGWLLASLQLFNLMAVLRSHPAPTESPYAFARQSLRLAIPLVPALLLVAGAIALAAPRVRPAVQIARQDPRFGYLRGSMATAGFTESVSLENLTEFRQSDAIALRIEGLPPGTDVGSLRLRMGTLEEFTGWEWRRYSAYGPMAEPKVLTGTFVPLVPEAALNLLGTTPQPSQAMIIRPVEITSGPIPLPENAIALSGLPPGTRVLRHSDGRVTLDQIRQPGRYIVHQQTGKGPDLLRGGMDGHVHRYLHPAFAHLAEQAFSALPVPSPDSLPLARARELSAYFRRNGTYTLELQFDQSGPGAIIEFMEKGMRGHCELFATALALALRHEGIPARLVTGFLGALPDEGGTYIVPHRHAHAWVEVWDEQAGWVTLDPTPPQPLTVADHSFSPAELASLLAAPLMGAVQWLEGYDYDRQQGMIRSARRSLAQALQGWEKGALPRAWKRFRRNLNEPPIFGLLSVLLAVNLGAWMWKHRRREQAVAEEQARRLPDGAPIPPLLAGYLKALGHQPARGGSPRELLMAAHPGAGHLADLYAQWRYRMAGQQLEAAMAAEVERLAASRFHKCSR